MSTIADTSFSFLTQSIPTSAVSTPNILVALGIFAVLMAHIIRHTAPMRLTSTLVAAIHEAEKAYLGAIEAGMLPGSDVNVDLRLSRHRQSLQIQVSNIREASLRNSLSSWLSLREYFRGRSLTILECIWEVQMLKTDIEILKEEQLRELNPLRLVTATQTVFRRRRHSSRSTTGEYQH
ncbi:hypothetical protein K438DRAFT_1953607 [Mycena galopus ATCC 62051]|nr:hypothetical protein K438DRAFT_1953607 [Mycena galopus ATCC 62051]